MKKNMIDRIGSLSSIPENVADTAEIVVGNLTALKPVQAIAQGGAKLAEGVLKVVDENAKITRRWMSEIKS